MHRTRPMSLALLEIWRLIALPNAGRFTVSFDSNENLWDEHPLTEKLRPGDAEPSPQQWESKACSLARSSKGKSLSSGWLPHGHYAMPERASYFQTCRFFCTWPLSSAVNESQEKETTRVLKLQFHMYLLFFMKISLSTNTHTPL